MYLGSREIGYLGWKGGTDTTVCGVSVTEEGSTNYYGLD